MFEMSLCAAPVRSRAPVAFRQLTVTERVESGRSRTLAS
jgi:hypothetical protein